MENSDGFLGLHDFLDRMRQPSAADFVKSIKSFIVSFSNNAPDPERDGASVQEFFAKMEVAFRAHPLWAGCSEEELESAGESVYREGQYNGSNRTNEPSMSAMKVANKRTHHAPDQNTTSVQNSNEYNMQADGQGLEKYVMTKLFTRVFASHPDDVKLDHQLSEKMALIQQFIRPENLDIKRTFQNETSWLTRTWHWHMVVHRLRKHVGKALGLPWKSKGKGSKTTGQFVLKTAPVIWLQLAQKELQKINMYKAPRDKLVCILNCCKVIGNLLLHASISSEDVPGADEFLPVLIYVTIKANPPQLHSNLLYIQRYRSQSRLVAEAAYFFTNMLSAESFISNINAKALSMDETEFESNMETARALLSGISSDFDGQSDQSDYRFGGDISRAEPMEFKHQSLNVYKDKDSTIQSKSSESKSRSKEVPFAEDQLTKIPSLSDLENKGATMLLKEDMVRQVFRDYPYVFASVGDLTVNDVEDLLNNYKQLVFKYVSLAKGLGVTPLASSNSQSQKQQHPEATKEPEDTRAVKPNESPLASSNSESQKQQHPEETKELEDTRAEKPNESNKQARTDGDSDRVTLLEEENFESKLPQDEAPQDGVNDGTSQRSFS
uniref:VPS9 domain-containing protein n=1 Tax=Quercus lobata TaxID=97700 RepID=A0A7N2N5R6_QUELO